MSAPRLTRTGRVEGCLTAADGGDLARVVLDGPSRERALLNVPFPYAEGTDLPVRLDGGRWVLATER